ncbi:pyruvoyl-dependent arginine decarboxylase [Antrihabitans cavernicola]|uniref:Pyruvoyl-dependent arginine decarboxylase AaxB n=2 Tax=Antrihabitans cavernicola TaxID=2495913 RepID=A0A5A7S6M4_9NOCA|nr:pyruvoyl-dependent arginine decarboxylase [Spelaeibacter cavernicola]
MTTHWPTQLRRRRSALGATNGLTIELGSAIGVARTSLAAFDDALCQLGVGDVNLIRLSSVIPPSSRVALSDRVRKPLGWGDRLYCVFAEQHATKVGETAAAGIGWVLRDDGSGAGLFVEHEAPTETEVVDLIERSLADMTRSRGGRYTPVTMHTTEATCTGDPTCALVLAAYKSDSWFPEVMF